MPVFDADVVIAGAGPAGATAALHLLGSGLKVRVVDKASFPRDKICGDALSGSTCFELEKLKPITGDFCSTLVSKTAVHGIRFISPGLKTLDLLLNKTRPGFDAPGYVSTRIDFDNWLVQALKRLEPESLLEKTGILGVTKTAGGLILQTPSGEVKTRMVIGADGAHSALARFAGHKLQPQHHSAGLRQYYEGVTGWPETPMIELHFYRDILPGYFWIFPLPDGRANVGIGMLTAAVSRKRVNLRELMLRIIREHPMVAPRFAQARALENPKGFGLPLGSARPALSGDHFLLAGDAASLIDPFTGEGIGNAMTSGRLAAEMVRKCFADQRFSADYLQQYDHTIWKKLGGELHTSYRLQRMLRYPWLFDFIVSKSLKNAHLHRFLEDLLSDTASRHVLTRPGFYYRLLFNPR